MQQQQSDNGENDNDIDIEITTPNFIAIKYITAYITFPPANSLWTNRGGGS